MTLAEVMGILNFYKTEESTYVLHRDMVAPEEELERINKFFLETGEYAEIFDNRDEEYYPLYRYLIYLVRSDWDDYEQFQKESVSKWLDEVDVPASDLEENIRETNKIIR